MKTLQNTVIASFVLVLGMSVNASAEDRFAEFGDFESNYGLEAEPEFTEPTITSEPVAEATLEESLSEDSSTDFISVLDSLLSDEYDRLSGDTEESYVGLGDPTGLFAQMCRAKCGGRGYSHYLAVNPLFGSSHCYCSNTVSCPLADATEIDPWTDKVIKQGNKNCKIN